MVIALCVIIIVGAVVYQKEYRNKPVQKSSTQSQAHSQKQYDLFIEQTEDERNNNFVPIIKYIDFGTVETGRYKGWKRIVGLRQEAGPMTDAEQQHIFITKDNVTYLVDDRYTALSTSTSSYTIYNINKVVGTTTIPNPFPEMLTLKGVTLIRQGFLNISFEKTLAEVDTVLDNENNVLYQEGDISFLQENELGNYFGTTTSHYISDGTSLIAKDSAGIAVEYITTATLTYQEELQKNKDQDSNYVSTHFVLTSKNDYGKLLINDVPLYEEYTNYYQGGCGTHGARLNEQYIDQLILIGTTTSGDSLYRFKNPSHPLIQDIYERKIKEQYDSYKASKEWYLYSVRSPSYDKVIPPTFEQYIQKNPVVVMKDALGRYLLLGEYYYGLDGGCGKPVIYLYPEKETDVSLSFKNPVTLSIDIPKYKNGWDVRAYPDGTLADKYHDANSCDNIDVKRVGSEYAYVACKKNMYPYIYWAGETENAYPILKTGFVVANGDLYSVLEEKLTQLSLSKKEREDMLSYWVPELEKKKAPYYRISFLQTQDMNNLIPMNINPKPDSFIRIFLDWEPLSTSISIQPQELLPTKRQGFTYVEWGGLHR